MFKIYDNSKIEKQVTAAQNLESERRAWCIGQAVFIDETRPENLIALAEKIYAYVYGERP
jgi:hypothetical protein